MRRRAAAPLAAVVTIVGLLPGSGSGAQSPDEARFTFYNVHALADGVAVDFSIEGFLPIEEFVGIASVTSEASLGLGGSSALAALPDPGELVLTLPGTLSALAGVSGIPDYPAVALAEHPSRPTDEVSLVPDAGLGALTLQASAAEDGSAASAAVTDLVDTVGLLPAFTVGSIRTTATTRRIAGRTLEATASTTVGNLRLLGGLVHIREITSSVTTSVVNGVFGADASDIDISGATVAGVPVGITEEGIVGLGQPAALAPLIDQIVRPLLAQGIRVSTTPSSTSITDRQAEATAGALLIDIGLSVSEYPGRFALALGSATSTLEAAGTGGTAGTSTGTAGGGSGLTGSPAGSASTSGGTFGGSTGGSGGATSAPAAGTQPAGTATAAGGTGNQFVVTLPARDVADWQVDDLYRAIAAASVGLFIAGRVVKRLARRSPPTGSDLRHLWRW